MRKRKWLKCYHKGLEDRILGAAGLLVGGQGLGAGVTRLVERLSDLVP